MCRLLENRPYGALYDDVPAWGNALIFLQDVLKLRVARVAVSSLPDRRWYLAGPQMVDGPVVYYEDNTGSEIACWTSGVNHLQVFKEPRSVHPTMRSEKTLWPTTPNAQNEAREDRAGKDV
jgi:hypothetical protein